MKECPRTRIQTSSNSNKSWLRRPIRLLVGDRDLRNSFLLRSLLPLVRRATRAKVTNSTRVRTPQTRTASSGDSELLKLGTPVSNCDLNFIIRLILRLALLLFKTGCNYTIYSFLMIYYTNEDFSSNKINPLLIPHSRLCFPRVETRANQSASGTVWQLRNQAWLRLCHRWCHQASLWIIYCAWDYFGLFHESAAWRSLSLILV